MKKESEKQVKIFLDRLALLCAHTKKRNTQKHVTTTGLVEDAGECSIYIAKNDGLRDTDLAFVKCLENWLNKRTDSGAEASEHDDTMWIRMVNFWQSRINYYAQEVEKLWKKIGDAEMETSRHFSGPDALYAFHKKWSMIRERVDLAAKLKGGQQDDGATEIFETFYFFFNRAPSLDISRGNEVRPYRKIVAAIEMLGMPQSMWNAFLAFREHPDWTNIRIVVIRKPELPSPKLDISGIMQVLMAWKWQKTRLGIDESLEELRKTNNPPELYFHCELQMLSILHGRANAHWYIGCSKLSCELCWLILRDGSYTTRGSHHKISANCAFHFPDDLEQGMTRLKEIHKLFKGKIFRSPLDEWTKYANLLGTDPQHTGLAHTDNLVDEVSHRPFVVGYKLMNISRQQKNLLVYYSDQFPATRGRYGPYQIDANLEPSVGGFATVYKAIKCYDPSSSHPGRQNFFALKEIVIKDKGQCVDIAAEHAILHKIVPHRNLLRLVEAFYISDPRIVYFATKLWAPVSWKVISGHGTNQTRLVNGHQSSYNV